MNKIESKKIMDLISKNPLIEHLFRADLMGYLVLKNGEIFDGDDKELEPREFLQKYEKQIDFKKLLVTATFFMRKTGEGLKSDIYKVLYGDILNLARENISEKEEIITITLEGKKNSSFVPINSRKELYGLSSQDKKFKADPELLPEIFRGVKEDDILNLFEDQNLAYRLADRLVFNTFDKLGYSDAELDELIDEEDRSIDLSGVDNFLDAFEKEKKAFLAIPEVKKLLMEDNLYVISAFSYIESIKLGIRNYLTFIKELEKLEKEGKSEKELMEFRENNLPMIVELTEITSIRDIFNEVIRVLDPSKVTIKVIERNEKEGTKVKKDFQMEPFIKEMNSALSGYASIYIREDKRNLFNIDILQLLEKDKALSYGKGIVYPDNLEYFFLLYQAGVLSYPETVQIFKDNGAKETDLHSYAERAVARYLTNNNNIDTKIMKKNGLIQSEEKVSEEDKIRIIKSVDDNKLLENIEEDDLFFARSLQDEKLYELLDDAIKLDFFNASMRQYTSGGKYKDVALKNIFVLLEKGDLAPDILKTIYSVYGMDIESIEKVFGKDMIKQSFSADNLLDTVNDIRDNLPKRNDTKEGQRLYGISMKEYEYLKRVNQIYGFTKNKAVEEEVLNVFDDLIFDDEVFSSLYLDGLVSVKTLYGYNDTLAMKLYSEGKLRAEDQKYMLFNTDADVKAGDLIRLTEAQMLNSQDVVELYMAKKINLSDIAIYAEDFDVADGFTEEQLLKYARDYSIIGKAEEKEKFKRFTDGFAKYKTIDKEQEEKLYKMISRRHPATEELIEFYSNGLFSLDTINPSDRMLVEMIKQGRLKSEDEEKLFKDTEPQGTKYIRLMNVLRMLDNDYEKLNLLAGVYKTEDEISTRRLNILANELSEVYSEDTERTLGRTFKTDDIDFDPNDNLDPNGDHDNNGEDDKPKGKQRAVRSLAKMFDAFKSIKANYEHQLVAGTYIVYLDDKALVEQVFKKSGDNQKFSLDHATYIISEDFFKYHLREEYDGNFRDTFNDFFVDVNRFGRPIFRWQMLIKAKKKKVAGIDKAVHKKNWARNLKAKVGHISSLDEGQLKECLDDIDSDISDDSLIE